MLRIKTIVFSENKVTDCSKTYRILIDNAIQQMLSEVATEEHDDKNSH